MWPRGREADGAKGLRGRGAVWPVWQHDGEAELLRGRGAEGQAEGRGAERSKGREQISLGRRGRGLRGRERRIDRPRVRGAEGARGQKAKGQKVSGHMNATTSRSQVVDGELKEMKTVIGKGWFFEVLHQRDS